MDNLGNQAAAQANLSLSNEHGQLLVKTSLDIDALIPLAGDEQQQLALRHTINEATELNENNAQLIQRLKSTAQVSQDVIGKVVSYIKKTLI